MLLRAVILNTPEDITEASQTLKHEEFRDQRPRSANDKTNEPRDFQGFRNHIEPRLLSWITKGLVQM